MQLTKIAPGLVIMLCTGLSIIGQQVTSQDQSNAKMFKASGAWWKHVSSNEQQGFIWGYTDCRRVQGDGLPITVFQESISRILDHNMAKDDPNGVVAALIQAARTTAPQRQAPGGEVYSGPHGFLTGEWWGSFPDTWPAYAAQADRGFLEGYLTCSSKSVSLDEIRVYQSAIDEHYKSGLHEHDAIADVLRGLRKR